MKSIPKTPILAQTGSMDCLRFDYRLLEVVVLQRMVAGVVEVAIHHMVVGVVAVLHIVALVKSATSDGEKKKNKRNFKSFGPKLVNGKKAKAQKMEFRELKSILTCKAKPSNRSAIVLAAILIYCAIKLRM